MRCEETTSFDSIVKNYDLGYVACAQLEQQREQALRRHIGALAVVDDVEIAPAELREALGKKGSDGVLVAHARAHSRPGSEIPRPGRHGVRSSPACLGCR